MINKTKNIINSENVTMSDEPPLLPNKCEIYKQTDLIASRYVTIYKSDAT